MVTHEAQIKQLKKLRNYFEQQKKEACEQIKVLENALALTDYALANVEGMLDEMQDFSITYNLVIESLAKNREVK